MYDHKVYMKQWRIENAQKYRDGMRQWREKNRFHVSLEKSREHAANKGHTACNATVDELRASFTGYCELCGKSEHNKKLHMDHDHKTGKFRGWLCRKCNSAAGYVNDSPQIAFALALYLERNFNFKKKGS